MTRNTYVGLLFATSLLFHSSAKGQFDLLYKIPNATANNYIGIAAVSAGDVNKDGRDDFIMGVHNPLGRGFAGEAVVYSGANGSVIYHKYSGGAENWFGYSAAAAGDVNGDGRGDYIIGVPMATPGGMSGAGAALVYSGYKDFVLYQIHGAWNDFYLGWSVAGAGDVNADGRDDFIVGAYGARFPGTPANVGAAYVYSGADGRLLYEKRGTRSGDYLGWSVAGAGDVNADGHADFIIGVYFADPGGRMDAGSALVYSGADGSLLYQKDGEAPDDRFGNAVAGAGDVNGDGKADFIIGAYITRPGGMAYAGSIYVYSGADGSLLYKKDAEADEDWFGYSVAGGGDVNGDGKADFIVGAPGASPGGRGYAGSAYVYSGEDGSLLARIDGESSDDWLGISVSSGDVNGDGKPDIIVGAPLAEYSVQVYGSSFTPGDLNLDRVLTPADLALHLNCAFLGSGTCRLGYVDLDCDGVLSSADVVREINQVFLEVPPGC